MNKVYLVMGERGSYDDWISWVVEAHDNESTAEERAQELNKVTERPSGEYQDDAYREYTALLAEVDPGGKGDWFLPPEYKVISTNMWGV